MTPKDMLGNRMKENYEAPARHTLTRRTPVIIRVDGRAFHTFTRGANRPFDANIVESMVYAAERTAEDIQGFKLGYVQSDEASFLLTDFDTFETQPWFGNVKSKLESITASMFTAHFNQKCQVSRLAFFDARAFSAPVDEVANYFLWRALDWQRNSISMYCAAHFSPKQMLGKGRAAQLDLLESKGMCWKTDLSDQLRQGTFVLKDGTSRTDIPPAYAEIAAILEEQLEVKA